MDILIVISHSLITLENLIRLERGNKETTKMYRQSMWHKNL